LTGHHGCPVWCNPTRHRHSHKSARFYFGAYSICHSHGHAISDGNAYARIHSHSHGYAHPLTSGGGPRRIAYHSFGRDATWRRSWPLVDRSWPLVDGNSRPDFGHSSLLAAEKGSAKVLSLPLRTAGNQGYSSSAHAHGQSRHKDVWLAPFKLVLTTMRKSRECYASPPLVGSSLLKIKTFRRGIMPADTMPA